MPAQHRQCVEVSRDEANLALTAARHSSWLADFVSLSRGATAEVPSELACRRYSVPAPENLSSEKVRNSQIIKTENIRKGG